MSSKTRIIAAAGAFVLAGAGAGAALGISGAADAASSSYSYDGSSSDRGHGDETPLTGATADKVKAAALAEYPGATIDRLETDSDGVYEAHLTTKTGEDLIVQIDKNFTVTGTQTSRNRDDD